MLAMFCHEKKRRMYDPQPTGAQCCQERACGLVVVKHMLSGLLLRRVYPPSNPPSVPPQVV